MKLIDKLKNGIESLDETFYEDIKMYSDEIINDRIKEIDEYLMQLEINEK